MPPRVKCGELQFEGRRGGISPFPCLCLGISPAPTIRVAQRFFHLFSGLRRPASFSWAVFARVWIGLEAEWIYPSPTQSGESSLRGSCAVPVFFWIRGAILSGRRDFNITNNARLSPKLCSTQRVSRKDHSNRSSGGGGGNLGYKC